jgi:hypothetical protein
MTIQKNTWKRANNLMSGLNKADKQIANKYVSEAKHKLKWDTTTYG